VQLFHLGACARRGEPAVEQSDLVAALPSRVDEMATHEGDAAQDEDAHGAAWRARRG